MQKYLEKYWSGLVPRERQTLGLGAAVVGLLLFYQFLWAPWHSAIEYMQTALIDHRKNLVWIQQQSELLADNGVIVTEGNVRGAEDSLMSVIEKSAGATGVRDAIQQLMPRQNNSQVSVVLQGVSFNKWVQWVDSLQSAYGVSVSELSAERDEKKPDIADIRVTFERK